MATEDVHERKARWKRRGILALTFLIGLALIYVAPQLPLGQVVKEMGGAFKTAHTSKRIGEGEKLAEE